MNTEVSTLGSTGTVKLKGRLDFPAHRAINAAVDVVLGRTPVSDIEIDLSGVDYVDSAGLGMLLVIRDKALRYKQRVILSNPSLMVGRILEVANFERIFPIRAANARAA